MANRPDGINTHSRPIRASSTASMSRSSCSLMKPAPLEIRRALSRWQHQVVHVHGNHDPRLLALAGGNPTVFTVPDPVITGQPVIDPRLAVRLANSSTR